MTIHCRRCGQSGHLAKTCKNERVPYCNQLDGWALTVACPLCHSPIGECCTSLDPRFQYIGRKVTRQRAHGARKRAYDY